VFVVREFVASILPYYLQIKKAMLYVTLFFLLVAMIGIVTNRLNEKPRCDHQWEHDHNSFKCCKCGKKIPDYLKAQDESFIEAA